MSCSSTLKELRMTSTPEDAPRPTFVVNEKDLEPLTLKSEQIKHFLNGEPPSQYEFVRRSFTNSAGSKRLGCSLMEVPPGKAAFPYHYHLTEEEGLYILGGQGRLRLGPRTVKVGKGDYIALLPGKEHAHQLWNTGDETLRYLCFATNSQAAEICVYPDSSKVGVFNGEDTTYHLYPSSAAVTYFHGEPHLECPKETSK